MKRIAVLTSGGDAPGMNAAVRAVVRTGLYYGYEVLGVKRGYHGLIHNEMEEMVSTSVSDILYRGGTILQTARCPEFEELEYQEKAVENLKKNRIDALVVIGGDGSFNGAKALCNLGIQVIGLPGTIDNDLDYTDYTIGFDTAVSTVMESVSKIRDTSSSHNRTFVVEVMGRNCGDIALYAGIVAGAEQVIVPEIPVTMDHILEDIETGKERGKNHHIILFSEGSGDPYEFTKKIQEVDPSARLLIIGHLQRGGSPTAHDRLIATRMGGRAVELIQEGVSGVAVGIKGNEIVHVPFQEALDAREPINKRLFDLAEILAR